MTAGPGPDPAALEELADILDRNVAAWPASGAVGAVLASGVIVTAGDTSRLYNWASVTKLASSLAALVAVEEGVVALDDPAGPPGSTLAHLLAHASGLPFDGDSPVSRPGRRRIYSNTGIEVAAQHVAHRADMAFADYLSDGVFAPLAMATVSLEGSPAHAGRSSLHDLLALAAEMMAPTLVSPAMWAQATSVAFPGLVGVVPGFGRQAPCDWGLGPEIRSGKSPHWTGALNSPRTYGHFGMSGAFLWVDPRAGLSLCGLCATDFDAWAKASWPRLSDEVVGWARAAGCSPLGLPPR